MTYVYVKPWLKNGVFQISFSGPVGLPSATWYPRNNYYTVTYESRIPLALVWSIQFYYINSLYSYSDIVTFVQRVGSCNNMTPISK